LKCDGTRAETRFRLLAKRTSPFKSVGASVQSTTGSRNVHISGSNAGYTMFQGSVKGTGYPLHSPVTICHHISTGVYHTAVMSVTTNNCDSTAILCSVIYLFVQFVFYTWKEQTSLDLFTCSISRECLLCRLQQSDLNKKVLDLATDTI